MKIDQRANVPVEALKRFDKRDKENIKESSAKSDSKPDRVDAKLSKALKETVGEIERSNLSAADVHSKVDEAKVSGLLHSLEIRAKQPKVSDDKLKALADDVARLSEANPAQARAAFNEFDPARVAELV